MPVQNIKMPNGIQIPYDLIGKVTGNELKTLMGLTNYMDKNGWCHPKSQTLEADLDLSRGTISTCTKSLHEKGIITVYHRKDPETGKNTSNLYQVHVGKRYIPKYDKADDQPEAGQSMSNFCHSRDQKLGAKEQTNNYTQREVSIADWQPSQETFRTISETLGDAKAQELVDHFKARCVEKGYKYSDPDKGLLNWHEEDQKKKLETPAKKRHKRSKTAALVASTSRSKAALLDVPEDIQEVLSAKVEDIQALAPQQRFMAALYWIASQTRDAKSVFEVWLTKLKLTPSGDGWVVRAKSMYAADYLSGEYGELMRAAGRKFDVPLGTFT